VNYIKQLQDDKVRLAAATNAAILGLSDLVAYLSGDKFVEDPTVQVQDVINRIREIQNSVYDEGFR
jgi:hypothetical protein